MDDRGLTFGGTAGLAANVLVVGAVALLLSTITYRLVEANALRLSRARARPPELLRAPVTADAASAPAGARRRGHMTQLDALRFFAVLGVIGHAQLGARAAALDLRRARLRRPRRAAVLRAERVSDHGHPAARGTPPGESTGRRVWAMRQFYVRRFLRNFPIYYLVLVVCLILAVEPAREVLAVAVHLHDERLHLAAGRVHPEPRRRGTRSRRRSTA